MLLRCEEILQFVVLYRKKARLRALYTPFKLSDFYCVTLYLTEKLSELRSFDRK